MNPLLPALCLAATSAFASGPNLGIGDPAPPITVAKWVQGTPVKNGVGGLRVVEFWATWCPPCKESIPHLTELSKKYKGKVTFTGVDVSERTSDAVKTVTEFLKTMGSKMIYNVAVDDKAGTMNRTWMEAAHQDGIPTAFILNKQGTVVWIGHPMEGLDKALDQILAGTYDVKKAKAEYLAQLAAAQKQEKEQAMQQGKGQLIEAAVQKAFADYKAGKKTEALAALDKVQAGNPELKNQIPMMKFEMVYDTDKAAANAVVEQVAKEAGKDAPYAYLQFGVLATTPHPNPPGKDDFAFSEALAEKALKIAPTNPIAEFESAVIYAKAAQWDKAVTLSQSALKDVPNAPAEIQAKLKSTIETKLKDFQNHKAD